MCFLNGINMVSVVPAVHLISPHAFWERGGQAECTLGDGKVKRGRERCQ